MARNVGAVEITVEADTTKLTAEMKAAGNKAGREYADEFEDEMSDVDGRELLARLRAIMERAKQQLEGLEAELGIDTSGLGAKLDAVQARLDAADLDLFIDANLPEEELRGMAAEAEVLLGDALLDIDTEFDAAKVQGDHDAINEILSDIEVDVDTNIDRGGVLNDRDSIEALMGDIEVDVDTNVDVLGVIDDKEVIDATLGDVEVDIDTEASVKDMEATKGKLDAFFAGAGSSSGSGFMGGFSNSISDGSELAVMAIAGLGPGIAQGIEGLLGAASAIISSGFYAIAGGAGAAAPVVAALGTALGSVLIGSTGVPEALKAINDEIDRANAEDRPPYLFSGAVAAALDKLSPAARDFVFALADIRPAWDDMKKGIQEELFSGLADQLDDLAKTALPSVAGAFRIAARSTNDFIEDLIDIAKDTDFKGTMEALDPALRNAFNAAGLLVDTLEPFLKSAAPAAETLTGWIEDAAEAMHDWVEANPQKLKKFFDDGVVSLILWGGLLSSVGGALATFFESGKEDGDAMVARLDRVVTKWDEWMESVEGQQALRDFFEGGSRAIGDLQPVFDGLVKAWDILTEDPEGGAAFTQLMEDLGAIIPDLAEILQAIGQMNLGGAVRNTIEVLGTLAEIFQFLPDPMQEFAGQVLVITKLMGPLNAALKSIGMSSGWMIALNLAVSAGVAIWGHFADSQSEVDKNTERFGRTLSTALDQVIVSGDAANSARAGYLALNEAMRDTEDAENVSKAMGNVNMTMDEVGQTMLDMAGEGWTSELAGEFKEIGEGMGLSAVEAQNLAAAAGTGKSELGNFDETIAAIAESSELSEDQLRKAAEAMRFLNEKADSVDFTELLKGQLEAAAGADQVSQSALTAAEEIVGIPWEEASPEQLVDIYNEYANQLVKTAEATDARNAAEAAGIATNQSALETVQEQIAASHERAEQLKAERDAAFDTYQAEQRAADQLLRLAGEVAAAKFDIPESVADGFIALGEAFDDAKESADAFQASMEVLLGGFPEFQEATSNAEEALDGVREALTGIGEDGEKAEDFIKPALTATKDAFDLTEQSGRDAAASVRDAAQGILDYAAAGLAAGEDVDELTAGMERMREDLVQQLDDFGMTRAAAETYVETLLGTPELLETVISTPNLINALLNAEDLTLLYDDMGNPVITEFQDIGLDLTEQQARDLYGFITTLDGATATVDVGADGIEGTADDIEGVTGDVETLDESEADPLILATNAPDVQEKIIELQRQMATLQLMKADPTINLSDYDDAKKKLDDLQREVPALDLMRASPDITLPDYNRVKGEFDTLQAEIAALALMVARPDISLPDYATVKGQIDTLQAEVAALDLMRASISVDIPGIWTRISEVHALQVEINNLHGRTIEIHTTYTSSGSPHLMAGGIVGSPGTFNLGERGLAEAVVPLELPLNRVDPAVREMAALLRGQIVPRGGAQPATGGPTLNLTQVITPIAADPVQVAMQVVNRAAQAVS